MDKQKPTDQTSNSGETSSKKEQDTGGTSVSRSRLSSSNQFEFASGSPLCSTSSTDEQHLALRQETISNTSSLVDDSKYLMNRIPSFSNQKSWAAQDAIEYDPSVSSIKGDSVSATIADYERKHPCYKGDKRDTQSTKTARQPTKVDDRNSEINYLSVGDSSTGSVNQQLTSSRPRNSSTVLSISNRETFDVIEERTNVSPGSGSDVSSDPQLINCNSQQPSPSLINYNIHDLPQDVTTHQIEPIILRGNGNLTLFGLSNSFSAEFPSSLIGKVSREEFDCTMKRVNSLLKEQQSLSAKLLLCGSICCCCSLGLSLVWPSIVLKRRSKMNMEKLLASENSRLYTKLGLNLKLSEHRCFNNHSFVEYVLMLEYVPKIDPYLPD